MNKQSLFTPPLIPPHAFSRSCKSGFNIHRHLDTTWDDFSPKPKVHDEITHRCFTVKGNKIGDNSSFERSEP